MSQPSRRIEFDFNRYDEPQWTPWRDERYPTAGAWTQEEGFIVPRTRPGATEEELFGVGGNGCFAMRMLRDLRMADGRLEMDVSLTDRAAPYLCFRVQPGANGVHGSLYALVVFNQVWGGTGEQGVNLWKFFSADGARPAAWRKLAWWNVPIPRERRLSLGAAFRKERMRVWFDGALLGDACDYEPLGPGMAGFAAIEGITRFHRFAAEGVDLGNSAV